MMSNKSKLIESAITKIVRRVLKEGSSPKFSVGQLVVYKKASKPMKVISVSNDSYEPTYKLKFVDNGKEVTEGESSLMKYNGVRYKNESKVNTKKLTEAKSGLNLALPNCNLFVKGWGLDKNGNMRIIVGFPNDKGFPIQTNGTLPRTNAAIRNANEGSIRSELPTIGKEVLAYVQKYGPATVKNRLKVYGQSSNESVRRVVKSLTEGNGQLEFMQTDDNPSGLDVIVNASENYDKFVVKTGSGEQLGTFSSDKEAFAAAKTYITQKRRGSVYFIGYTGNKWKSE